MRNRFDIGNDLLDMRDVAEQVEAILALPEDERDDEEKDYLAAALDLQGQLFNNSLADYGRNAPTMVRDSYMEDWAEEYARGIGALGDVHISDWPFNRLDWKAAADDLKDSMSEVTFGGYTYFIEVY